MSALARLKVRLEQKRRSNELTKLTKGGFVGFVSRPSGSFSKSQGRNAANDHKNLGLEALHQFRFDLIRSDFMALRDWIGKGNHGAIHAIYANNEVRCTPKIAKIAEIALAKQDNKQTVFTSAVASKTAYENLEQFRFDLIPSAIAEGSSEQEIDRVNNMAWEFMKVDEMAFADAIRRAAEIAVSCEVSACEAAYEDVQALWRRLSG